MDSEQPKDIRSVNDVSGIEKFALAVSNLNVSIDALDQLLKVLSYKDSLIFPFSISELFKKYIEFKLKAFSITKEQKYIDAIDELKNEINELSNNIKSNDMPEVNLSRVSVEDLLKGDPWYIDVPVFIDNVDCFVDSVFEHLTEVEAGAKDGLTVSNHAKKVEDMVGFRTQNENIQAKASSFLETYYQIIQLIEWCLDSDEILLTVERCLLDLRSLRDLLNLRSISEADSLSGELIDSLNQKEAFLLNKKELVKKDVNNSKTFTEDLLKNVFEIKKINDDEIEIYLSLENPMGELSENDRLMNYQVKNIININKMLLRELNDIIYCSGVSKIFVREIGEGDLKDFKEAVEQDKDCVREIVQFGVETTEDRETFNSIIDELAMNLVYRLVWEGQLELVAVVD